MIKESPEHLATKKLGSRAVFTIHTTSRCIIFGMAVAVAWLFVLRDALNISRIDKSTRVTRAENKSSDNGRITIPSKA